MALTVDNYAAISKVTALARRAAEQLQVIRAVIDNNSHTLDVACVELLMDVLSKEAERQKTVVIDAINGLQLNP